MPTGRAPHPSAGRRIPRPGPAWHYLRPDAAQHPLAGYVTAVRAAAHV